MPDPRDEPFDEDAFDDTFDDEIEDELGDDAYASTARTEAVTVDAYAPPPDTTVVRRGVGLPVVLLTGIVAAVAGAAGGYGLASTFPPVAPVTDDIVELRAELAALDATERLSRLSERVEAIESRRAPRVDLSPLETRLAALEARPEPVPDSADGIDADTDVDIGTESDTEDGVATDSPSSRPALTPALARRLSTLERRVAALESEPAPAVRVTTQPVPTEAASRPTAAQPTAAQPTAARPAPARAEDLPPYPFAAVEAAISADEPSTFRRILKVRDRTTVEALDALRAALEAGDIAGALAAHSRLPDAARTEAADWARRARATQ